VPSPRRCSPARTSRSGRSSGWRRTCCTGRTGSSVAGALTIAAGVYEVTPLKRDCRRRCRENTRSGFHFGFYCVGSSIGLMVVLFALGVMSIAWMSVIAALVLAQKLLPLRMWVDVPVALAIIAVGILTAVAPSTVPI